MRKFNKKTKPKKPKQKSVKKPRKQKKRKSDDRFVTKRKSKSPASWQNLGLDSPNTNARRSSINVARFTLLRAQDLLKRHGFGATMHMLNQTNIHRHLILNVDDFIFKKNYKRTVHKIFVHTHKHGCNNNTS